MNAPGPNPFTPDWPEPETRFLRPELPRPPAIPLEDVLGPRWARWIRQAAESKASPPDYVAAALLSVAGALIGNTRWASPWDGWAEPPVIWAMAIGTPSMNKSPGLDAVLTPLKRMEREARNRVESVLSEWRDKAELAKLTEQTWREAVRSALKSGDDMPAKPAAANPGQEPVLPRYALTDATVEKIGVILAGQPRGAMLARDELSGWLMGMTRYSGGGSDRPFWLEAYGGRSFSVERMGRDPVYIDRLTVGVLGGIQPDKLKTLLFKSDDDGLLARFLPVWPDAAPIKRPDAGNDEAFLRSAFERLLTLEMAVDESGIERPWFVTFCEDARSLLDEFRQVARGWETGAEGLLLSFAGKLPGMAIRLSLILAYLDWAGCEAEAPREISKVHFARAAHFVEAYVLPMARRAYADGSTPKEERAARRLVGLIKAQGWRSFNTPDILRLERADLATKADLDPALSLLAEANVIRLIPEPIKPKGGRPPRFYSVNPAIWGMK
jgi:hypothetical protein